MKICSETEGVAGMTLIMQDVSMEGVFVSLLEWFSSRTHIFEIVVALLVLLLLPTLVKTLWNHWCIYSAFKKVPMDTSNVHFLFGHAPMLLQDMGAALDWMMGLSRKPNNWKTIRISYGPALNQLVCVHPDSGRLVLRSDPKSDEIYSHFVPWLGRGLLIANGPRWVRSRRLLTPAFHFDILRPYVKVYREAANVLTDLWAKVPEGDPINVFPYISLFTLDVMLQCTCSYKSECQVNKYHSPYVGAVYELSDLVTDRILSFAKYYDLLYMLTPDYWKFRRACNTVHKFSMEVIQKRRAELKEKKNKGEDVLIGTKRKYLDFIDMLLEARDENGVGLSDLEIRAEVDTFMFEGHDTTASGIVWTLYNLAKHPEHQEKCRQEVDAIFDEKDAIETEDLKKLLYLKYCIKESMRLFPPVAAFGRSLAEPTEIDGVMFPRGTPVVCATYTIHRHPQFWDNPDEFDPLRFTPENCKGRHPHAYIPFSAGPRNCIGQEFALNEERVALAHILRRFEFTLDESKPVKKDFLIILRPKPGLFLRLKHRH